jgi:hypothetical protein
MYTTLHSTQQTRDLHSYNQLYLACLRIPDTDAVPALGQSCLVVLF